MTFTPPSTLSIASATGDDAIDISPSALTAALSGLGGAAPANYAAARTALIDALSAPTPDELLIAKLKTVAGAWGVAQARKNRVNSIWGNAGAPQSVAGGIAAVRAAEVFFASFPDRPSTGDPDPDPGTKPPAGTPPTSTPPVAVNPGPGATTAQRIRISKLAGRVTKAPTTTKRGRYKVRVTVPSGQAVATGKVTVKLLKKGKKTKTLAARLKNGVATLSVPRLAKGKWRVAISWSGDATYLPASAVGRIKVRK